MKTYKEFSEQAYSSKSQIDEGLGTALRMIGKGVAQMVKNRAARGALNPFGQRIVRSGAAGRQRVPVYSGRSGTGPMTNASGRTSYATPDISTAGKFAQSNQLTKGTSSVPSGGTVYRGELPQRYIDKYGSRSLQGFRQVKMSKTAADKAFKQAVGGT